MIYRGGKSQSIESRPVSGKGIAALFMMALLALICAGQAIAFDVTLSNDPSANGSWSGANPDVWTPSGAGSVVSVSEIVSRLSASTDVTITSTSGSDLTVDGTVSWSTNTLTLSSSGNITISAAQNGSGTANLAIEYGQGAAASGNTAAFTVNAPVNLEATGSFSTKLGSDGGTLTYTIITTLGAAGSTTHADLQGMNGNLSGNYALGSDIDATSTSSWNSGAGFASIDGFAGVFDGLGHTVANLYLTGNGFGLFGATSNAVLRNVGLTNLALSSSYATYAGGLAGELNGSRVDNSYVTGTIDSCTSAGGLAGFCLNCTVTGSHTGVAISGAASVSGGLIGEMIGVSRVSNSYATGNVTGAAGTGKLGGLVGDIRSADFSAAGGYVLDGCYTTGNVWSDYDKVGGLVGWVGASSSYITINNSHASGQVTGRDNVGGLLGGYFMANGQTTTSLTAKSRDEGVMVTDSYATGAVSGRNMVGGLVGGDSVGDALLNNTEPAYPAQNTPVAILNSHATGTVNATGGMVGGLLGRSSAATLITDSYATGAVTSIYLDGGFAYTGGLVGRSEGAATLTNTYATGDVNSPGSRVGGLAGDLYGGSSVAHSYATGNVNPNFAAINYSLWVAGLVGQMGSAAAGSSISDSFATGNVKGGIYVGGLVGAFGSSTFVNSISNSYATGDVFADQGHAAGLGDDVVGTVTNCYAAGAVSANYGGVSALVNYATVVTDSYWNAEVNSAAGCQVASWCPSFDAVGKTAAELKQAATFASWDLDATGGTGKHWRIYEGRTYPLLRSYLTPLTVTADNVNKHYDGIPYTNALTNPGYSIAGAETSGHLFNLDNPYNGTTEGGTYAPDLYSDPEGYDISYVNGMLSIYYAVTPSAGAGGSISPNTVQYALGNGAVNFTATPALNYAVSGVTGCNAYLSGPNTITTGPVTADCTVTVSFTNLVINGACGTDNGQTLTSVPEVNLCASGTQSAVTGTGPWTWSCSGANGGSTATCGANIAIWNVTPLAGAGGTISPDTVQQAAHGTSLSFTVAPTSGFRIASVTGCNGSMTDAVTYTTAAIVSDCTVTAQFLDLGNLPQPGNALQFDGTDDYITIPDAAALDLTASYTIEAWIKPGAFKSLGGIVSKYVPGVAVDFSLNLGSTGTYSGINFDGKETADGVLQLNTWQHVAAVNDGGTRHVYVNGVEQSLTGSASIPVANSGPVVIGADNGSYFNGAIDEVRIWNTARTPAEVASDMTGTVEETSAGLVAYYRFDQGAAGGDNAGVTTLYDRTANAFNGTLTNFGLTGTSSNWIASAAPSSGSCGSDNGQALAATPVQLCSVGTASTVSGSGPWTWSCAGLYGGSDASCSASLRTWIVTPAAGTGGSIDPATPQLVSHGSTTSFTILPDSGYAIESVAGCSGSLTNATTYTTAAIVSNCTVTASFTAGVVNGACGTSNGQTFTSAPATNRCSSGTPSVVSGSGPWTWSCNGANGGATANCGANITTWNVTPLAGAGGTISPDTVQQAAHGTSVPFTVTPASGFRIASVTGCGGSMTDATTYTTGAITAGCTVTAQFLDLGNLTQPGNALQFDGTDDYVKIPDADALDLTASYTIEAWIKPGAFKVLGGIVSKYTTWGAGGFTLRLGSAGTYSGINFDGMETADGTVQLNTWQHLTAVNDGGTRHLYVNGVEKTLTGTPIVPAANSGPVVIGMDWDGRYFNGAIDEVRIWNTARTQAEIVSDMTGTVAETSVGLTAYYRFDQGAAGGDNTGVATLYDRTANAFDGTLTNFSLTGTSSNWIASAVPADGSCGSDNGQTLTSTPTNLCAAGTPSSVTGAGPWTWTCNGTNAGSDASCSASFQTWTVTPSAGSNGGIDPATSQIVSHGSFTSFTITPASGYGTQSVTGCNGTLVGNTYTTGAIAADCTVSASFAAVVSGSCGGDNGQTLTATPTNLCAAGTASSVSGAGRPWTWTCGGQYGGTSVDCSANIRTYTLTFTTDGNGTLVGATSQTVDHGASASAVQATASAGYHFVNWTGTNGFVTTSTNPLTVTGVTASMNITANFIVEPVNGACGADDNKTLAAAMATNLCASGIASAVTGTGHPWIWSCDGANGGTSATCSADIQAYALAFSTDGNGTLTGATSQTVDHGSSANAVQAVASTGYHFLNWTGTNAFVTTSTNPLIVSNVTASTDITAHFSPDPINGACGADDGQTVAATTPANLCAAGTASSVIGAGHPWTWTCGGQYGGTSADCSANIRTYALTFTTDGNGTLAGATSQTVDHGASASAVLASAFSSYSFVNWTGTNGFATTSTNPLTVVDVTAAMDITANFSANPVSGACGPDNNQTLAAIAPTNLCATGTASTVSGTGHPWTWSCSGVNGGTSADCSANIQTYTLTFTSDGNGTLTGTTSQAVDYGSSASAVSASASGGYAFVNWTGTNGFAATSENPLTLNNVVSSCSITANFSADPVNGSCGSSNNGTFATAPSTNLCATGTSSAVSGGGSWTWSCTGLNGGTTAGCSASVATDVPNGDVNGDGTVDTADALKALRIASGLDTASSSDLEKGDVAPLVSGMPQPDGVINSGDVVVILRKAVGLVNW